MVLFLTLKFIQIKNYGCEIYISVMISLLNTIVFKEKIVLEVQFWKWSVNVAKIIFKEIYK